MRLARQRTARTSRAGSRPHVTSVSTVCRERKNQPSKYTLVDIDRTANLGAMFPVVDAVTGLPAATRTDCDQVTNVLYVDRRGKEFC